MEKNPPQVVKLLRGATGTGKSHKARVLAKDHVDETGKAAVFAVPTHSLSDEAAAMFEREHGEHAAVWRGRNADDPHQPGSKMCYRSIDAEMVSKHGLDIENTLCKHKRKGMSPIYCPFHPFAGQGGQCGYQGQKQPSRIWFVAHESLIHEKPAAIGTVGLVIIDESPISTMLFQTELELDALTAPVDLNSLSGILLNAARRELHEALAALPEGYVKKSALERFTRSPWYEESFDELAAPNGV
jgi:putative DNA primase/helicase